MKYKGIIFDLDGTLIDSIEDISDSMNKTLEEFDMERFTYEEYKEKIGKGFRNLVINSIEDKNNEELINKMTERFQYNYDKNYINKSKPYVGIDNLLLKLKEKNINIAIFSNKKEEYTKKVAEKLLNNINFISILGEVKDRPIKPDPTGINIILEKMKLNKSEVIYVGDTNVDMITGKNSGLKTIGVEWGFRNRKELIESGADIIVSKPEEILELF